MKKILAEYLKKDLLEKMEENSEMSTGIGLYLCKKLCEKLGLGLYIDSKENYGTKVNIIFPTTENITE